MSMISKSYTVHDSVTMGKHVGWSAHVSDDFDFRSNHLNFNLIWDITEIHKTGISEHLYTDCEGL